MKESLDHLLKKLGFKNCIRLDADWSGVKGPKNLSFQKKNYLAFEDMYVNVDK